ncbi:hypothetical protein HOT95_gp087 [Vibrio phage vB_VpS_PG07]|uniref:Uncharacterized protein n=1 Tax=Vibrio phage vB_VpS_PG07 TaxID=2301664 RepID=A0A385E774_9CAUD|nr:hypothetical protein HOT95_gp087 [Vibrio phage vB_VpS_PG07]AXQ66712.1 hypothetical protein [Vibrio phage vB_VpS_PG07]
MSNTNKVVKAPVVGETVKVNLYTARNAKAPTDYTGRLQRSRSSSIERISAIYSDTEKDKKGNTLYSVLLTSGDQVLIARGDKGWYAVR